MQLLADILTKEQPKSLLGNSIQGSVRFVEESAYAKLVRHLKEKIKVFDTPLE